MIKQSPDDIVQAAHNGSWTTRMTRRKAMVAGYTSIHRLVQPTELVIDIDIKNGQNCVFTGEYSNVDCKKLSGKRVGWFMWQEIGTKIEKEFGKKCAYIVTDTSRSYHMHMWIPELVNYPYELRVAIKKRILRRISHDYTDYIDFGVTSENRLIRDIGSIHEKTGLPNKKVYVRGITMKHNKLPAWAKETKSLHNNNTLKAFRAVPDIDYTNWLTDNKFLQYVLNNKMPRGGRNSIVLKNLGIALSKCLTEDNKADIHNMCKIIAENCDKKSYRAVRSWMSWAQNRDSRYNYREVSQYLNKHGIEV